MTCEEHAQRMEQIESKLAAKDEVAAKIIERLAALEKKVAFQEALLQEQDAALHGLRDGCAERSRTLDSLKDWTETRLGELKHGFDDLDKRLGAIIDTLSDLTEKMLKELESCEQKQSVIDDGNSVELQRAPAEGE